jgi:DNA helicase HerA-like ATPase
MSDKKGFVEEVSRGYDFKGSFITLGVALLDGEVLKEVQIKAPLKMFNRHGLIAGATGTGKTKTLQGMAEALSEKGISALLMDIKGDLSGLAAPGITNAAIEKRHADIGVPWKAMQFPVEL